MLSATKRLLFVRLQKLLRRFAPQKDKAWLKTNGSPMVDGAAAEDLPFPEELTAQDQI